MSGRVLITGAAGALGRSVVQRFLDGGDRVLAVDANEAALGELTELAPSDRLSVRRVNLADSGEVERLFDDAEASGIPSAVVHLVGGFRWARFADLTDRDWSYLV